MDWQALSVSLQLGAVTVAVLLPLAIILARALAFGRFAGRRLLEALVILPLVLPPTVLGYYLLVLLAPQSWAGQVWHDIFGGTLVFSFEGLVLASVIANLPLAVQPAQRAFEAIPRDVREAAACCGMRPWAVLRRIELPLAWPGIATGMVMSFAHTLGEFGVVLMVGGSIPGETRTLAIAIYDSTQAFDDGGAALMAAILTAIALFAVMVTFALQGRPAVRRI